MTILPKAIYKFNAIPKKKPTIIPHRIRESNSKIHMEPKRSPYGQCKKKNKSGSNPLPDFKIYFMAVVTKIAWYCYKNRHIDQ